MTELPPGFVVRRAARVEATSVADVWLRSRHASVPAIPAPVHTDDEVRSWFAETVLPTREVWVVATATDAGAGAIVAVMVLDAGWIDQLHVDPPWFGRGFGSSLVEHAKHERPNGLDLWVFASNTDAQRFYERHGFIAVDATDANNEEGEPDIRYRWAPTAPRRAAPSPAAADAAGVRDTPRGTVPSARR